METIIIWVVNDLLSDGMPGKNSYFRTEAEAIEYFDGEEMWRKIAKMEAFEIDGTVYFRPKAVPFHGK